MKRLHFRFFCVQNEAKRICGKYREREKKIGVSGFWPHCFWMSCVLSYSASSQPRKKESADVLERSEARLREFARNTQRRQCRVRARVPVPLRVYRRCTSRDGLSSVSKCTILEHTRSSRKRTCAPLYFSEGANIQGTKFNAAAYHLSRRERGGECKG